VNFKLTLLFTINHFVLNNSFEHFIFYYSIIWLPGFAHTDYAIYNNQFSNRLLGFTRLDQDNYKRQKDRSSKKSVIEKHLLFRNELIQTYTIINYNGYPCAHFKKLILF